MSFKDRVPTPLCSWKEEMDSYPFLKVFVQKRKQSYQLVFELSMQFPIVASIAATLPLNPSVMITDWKSWMRFYEKHIPRSTFNWKSYKKKCEKSGVAEHISRDKGIHRTLPVFNIKSNWCGKFKKWIKCVLSSSK